MAQDELTTREQSIHHNKLIYAAERLVAVQSIVLRDSLNLLVEEVHVAQLIILLWIRYDSIDTLVENNYVQV